MITVTFCASGQQDRLDFLNDDEQPNKGKPKAQTSKTTTANRYVSNISFSVNNSIYSRVSRAVIQINRLTM